MQNITVMNRKTEFPAAMCEDEAVIFMADRYHTTPGDIISRFIAQDAQTPSPETGSFNLESNEMEILRELIKTFQ